MGQSDATQTRARPTIERLRKAGDDYSIGSGQSRIVTMWDNIPLERAKKRGAITEQQYAAATKYHYHWWHAGLSGHCGSMDLDRVFGGEGFAAGMPKSEFAAFHRQRYREAVNILGVTNSSFLEHVVCRDMPLVQAGMMLKWKHEKSSIVAATERLRSVLDRLRELWGLG